MSDKITPKDVRMHIAVHRKIEQAALDSIAAPKAPQKRKRRKADHPRTHRDFLKL